MSKKHHRGRRNGKKGNIIYTIILVVAIVVFCVSAFQLVKILGGYRAGEAEYKKIQSLAITNIFEQSDIENAITVDFDKLKEINSDTIGWIRFYPEPSEINYPIVQTTDNDKYLHKTFSENENTLGAIFLNTGNNAEFEDYNSIIYGHYMKDGSMFRKLDEYKDQEFWADNPYFYIYTPDGREITYHIYSVATVKDTDDVYLTGFEDTEAYQEYLDMTKSISLYDTGVEVTTDDTVVTLSTCTSGNDEHRFVVIGVKKNEANVQAKYCT